MKPVTRVVPKGGALAETYTTGFWRAKPGEEDAFAIAWTEFGEWIKEQPGVKTLRLVRDVNEPAKFISFANWVPPLPGPGPAR